MSNYPSKLGVEPIIFPGMSRLFLVSISTTNSYHRIGKEPYRNVTPIIMNRSAIIFSVFDEDNRPWSLAPTCPPSIAPGIVKISRFQGITVAPCLKIIAVKPVTEPARTTAVITKTDVAADTATGILHLLTR